MPGVIRKLPVMLCEAMPRDEMLLRGIFPEHPTLVDKAKSCHPEKKHVQHAYAQCRARFFITLLQT